MASAGLAYRGNAILRSDGEHAIVDPLSLVGAMRGVIETILKQTPKTDSRSNGRAERDVQKVQKKTRVLKLATERMALRLRCRTPPFCGSSSMPSTF